MSYTSKSVYEFISKQTNDPIFERKTCAISGQSFAIFQSDLDFYNKISPVFAGQRFQIPTPTLCPEERQRRRILFRNFFSLKKRNCAATGDPIISQYAEPHLVYSNSYRRSDQRDPMSYGQTINEQESFTEQFRKLYYEVPKYATHNLNCNNSQYCNMAANSNNCYLVAGCISNENCMYGHILRKSEQCFDMLYSKRSQQSYECIDCIDCTACLLCQDCEQCSFCIGCYKLQRESYCIYNKQYSKEEFEQFQNTIPVQEVINNLAKLKHDSIQVGQKLLSSEGCYGNEIIESQQCISCFDTIQSEHSKYLYTVARCQNSMDVSYTGLGVDYGYESLFPNGNKIMFSHNCQDNSADIWYSDSCFGSEHCFACVGLRNKSYCILNKQYSKEEYETTVKNIIGRMTKTGEWGEFFHPSLSPFGYNETVANEYFPLTQVEATQHGYHWQNRNYDPVIPEGTKVIDRKVTTEEPKEDEHILKAIFVCEVSGRPYRIIKQELEFYKKHNLPLPRKHPDIRHQERMQKRPERTLYLRNCDKTGEEMLSVYSANYPGKVYSEKAYQQEVYG